MDDPRLIVAVYAAGIATTALMWNIWSFASKSRASLDVTISYAFQLIADELGRELAPRKPTLKIIVVNIGPTIRHIERPIIEVSHPLDGERMFDPIRPDEVFPLKIEPGQRIEKVINLNDMERQILSRLPERSWLRAIVRDTLGKRFRSKKLRVNAILRFASSVRESSKST